MSLTRFKSWSLKDKYREQEERETKILGEAKKPKAKVEKKKKQK